MFEISESIVINRPIADVFAYVIDATNDPAWHTDILEAQKTSQGPIGKGTTWHVRFKPAMGISEGNMEVVDFEPNRLEVQRGAMGPMRPTLTYMVEPDNGGTKFTRRVQMRISGFMRVMSPLMKVMTAKGNRQFLANLKRVLEGSA
jgi:uncharacterized protein YndB with AHSA1/START domain